jgi:parallel beta-helix repeat protein
MFAQSPSRLLGSKFLEIGKFAATSLCLTAAVLCQAATVNIQPGDDIPTIVAANPAGTTFVIYPGTYRLQNHIVPLTGDSFIGQTACAPPTTTCPAILSGSTVIGPLATFNGTNYEVTGQTQQGKVTEANTVCQPGYLACNLPEDLFFDGVPYQHLYATSLPTIGPGQWWFDYTNHIIYFHDNPAGHTVETSVLDTAFDSTANNVTVQYLTVVGFANTLSLGAVSAAYGNVSPSSSSNWVITNCEMYNNHNSGVRIAFGTQVINNYLHGNGVIGVGGGTDSTTPSGVTIQGNTVSNNNYAKVLSGHGAGGIKFGDSANVVIRGNTVSNNDGAGIHFDHSSVSPLIDGNVVTNNTGGGGVEYEISVTSATMRNNVLLDNGKPDAVTVSVDNMGSYASVGVNAYCNVIEIPYITKGQGNANGMSVVASDRGYNTVSPYEYLMSTGNSYHHNTVIWDANATGTIGYIQKDAAHQPNFFADNTPPDHNTYHLPSLTQTSFIYDNNNTGENTHKTFATYQTSGADPHGTADTNNTSGFPTVAITSPADQSTVTGSVTIKSTASDPSGISKVEFYVDWNLQSTVTASPYNFTWSNGTAGQHTLAAMAYSKAGIRACYAITLTEQ